MTVVGYCGGETKHPTYESACNGDGHTEAIQIHWNPAETSYDRMLRLFLCQYRGGSLFYTQYKSAIWWHDEEQRKKARCLKIRITIVWLVWMSLAVFLCVWIMLQYSSLKERYWSLLITLVALIMFPGQLHVLPSCPWHNAEAYHQKYLKKQSGA